MADIKNIDVFQTVTSVSFEVEPNTNIININKVTTSGYSGVPNLQEVTDEGATTTNGITINVGDGGGNGISAISSNIGIKGESRETYGVYGNSPLAGVYGNSDTGYGVQGNSDNGIAVYGSSQNQIGIQGNSILGTAIYANSEYGTGLFSGSTEGVGISAYSTTNIGLEVNGNGTIAIEANLGNSNKGLVINSGASSTGNPIEIVKENITNLSVNQQGELTATKLIKQGGTSTQILAADGSVITAGTNITISGGTISSTGGGGGATNLSPSQTATNFTINSDTGTDATIPLGNGTLAGATLNDYTTAEKNKLAGIATGAEVNVNADWNAVSGDAQILNKPTIPTGSPITIVNDSSLFSTGLVGTGTGSNATNSNFFGYQAGKQATGANTSNFIGENAGYQASGASASNFIGQEAGYNAIDAWGSNFIGQSAGTAATNAFNSNFIGSNAGSDAINAQYSNFFGFNVGMSFTDNNVGSNNIIIGKNISLPDAAVNSVNLGGVLFGIETHSDASGNPSITPTTGGKIGIGVVNPTNTLHIYSEAANTSGLRLERLTSSSPTSTGQAIGVDASGNIVTVTRGGGGGSSVNYYLNGGTNQGTFGGSTYYEFSKTAVIGTGADFNISSNGYIASFITDVADPSLLLIPAGNWNLEFFFSSSSAGGSPSFYVELYKYDGTTFTLIASNSATPEGITGGTAIDAYFTPLAVPETILTVNDRLAIRVFVNASSKTITLHTQNGHLCEVITTFTAGLIALNGLQAQVQNFATGTTGTDFAINSNGSTHTFNLPSASATARGVVTTGSQTFAGDKTFTGIISASNLSNTNTGDNATNTQYSGLATSKQDTLQNTVNIKSINGNSILGIGDLTINASPASQSAYTILANNTNASAVPIEQPFQNLTNQVYSGIIVWTGGAAPTVANHTYSLFQVGNLVTLTINLSYGTVGASTLTNVSMELPSTAPQPAVPSSVTAAGDVLSYIPAYITTTKTQASASVSFATLRLKSTSPNVFEVSISRASAQYRYAYATIQYFV